MSKSKLETRPRSVNNQKLFKEIDTFMIEVFSIKEIKWASDTHRQQIVEMIEDFLMELAHTTGKIIQFDVICDRRNNPRSIEHSGKVNLSIKYKQKNCLNTTSVDYTLTL